MIRRKIAPYFSSKTAKNLCFLGVLLFLGLHLQAQESKIVDFNWDGLEDGHLICEGADYTEQGVPYFIYNLSATELLGSNIIPTKTVVVDIDIPNGINIGADFQLKVHELSDRRQKGTNLSLVPVRRVGHKIEVLLSAKINWTPSNSVYKYVPPKPKKQTSVLSSGTFYKLGILESGIYRIDHDFINGVLRANPSLIDPKQIQLFSGHPTELPEANSADRIDDLEEVAIQTKGLADGTFDKGDYILFYGQGPHEVLHRENNYDVNRHHYSDSNFYFLRWNVADGKRQITAPEGISGQQLTYFEDVRHLEEDKESILSTYEGGGREWFGDKFEGIREKDYSDFFRFKDLITDYPIHADFAFIGRSKSRSRIQLIIDGTRKQASIPSVSLNDLAIRARYALISENIPVQNENFDVKVVYPTTSTSSTGYLDYLRLIARRKLILEDQEILRYSGLSSGEAYTLSIQTDAQESQIWDLKDIQNPQMLVSKASSTGYHVNFLASGSSPAFIFIPSPDDTMVPVSGEAISNQDLHSISSADMLVIYHPLFEPAVDKLISHRKSKHGLTIEKVNIHHIYNEFSSGKMDPTAIRDFVKMIYDRSPNLSYLLLFGDGSYDYKSLDKKHAFSNFVPPFETKESLNPLSSFTSDDFYALLDDNEGEDLKGALDIAVGRIPAGNLSEANSVVDKIIAYENNLATNGNWRTTLTFVADDEDNNRHFRTADFIAESTEKDHPEYLINKIYSDAFEQEYNAAGESNPKTQQQINNSIFKGTLILNYLGHGGPKGWAQENILTVADIKNWTNNHFPLLITATCSFTGFDNQAEKTGGEIALVQENAGVVALYSTVRPVYASSNERLTKAVFNQLFERRSQKDIAIGEILRKAKNANSADTLSANARKFALFGDPSMPLALPQHQVILDKINDVTTTSLKDTLGALDLVRIEGHIGDATGQVMENYNGEMTIKLMDKKIKLSTLGQDKESKAEAFSQWKSILFNGKASVKNGRFSFEFRIPKDINYSIGNGKFYFYATDAKGEDAAGYFQDFQIGGDSNNQISDDEGPEVDIWIDDKNFINGSQVSDSPTLLLDLKDDLGINVTGNSVGHDLECWVDEKKNRFLLNDFFQSNVDESTRGQVSFPLGKLEPGKHRLYVKAWDIANNSTEKFVDFVIENKTGDQIDRVLNYPNPFTDKTEFMVAHNMNGEFFDITIDIFSVSGKLVKRLVSNIPNTGNILRGIFWDGQDNFGGKLANGTYQYRIRMSTKNNQGKNVQATSGFQKLVILR